jgi:hypothetical protein
MELAYLAINIYKFSWIFNYLWNHPNFLKTIFSLAFSFTDLVHFPVNLPWISVNGYLINRYYCQICMIDNIKELNFHFTPKHPEK